MKKQQIVNKIFWIIFFVLIVVFSYWVGRTHTDTKNIVPLDSVNIINTVEEPTNVDFGLFWNVWETLKEYHVNREKIDAQDLLRGAIDGMLSATNDPYTIFLDAEEQKLFNEELSGTFEGIGAEIGIYDEVLTVVAPLPKSPAEKAGLLAGDLVIKIDGEITTNIKIQDAVSKIRGERGSQVILTIFREGADDVIDITVTRDRIIVESVIFERYDDIAYIQITRFGPKTAQLFKKNIQKFVNNSNARGLIIDVRNNPGGFLESSVSIASIFLPKDSVVVISEYADGEHKLFTTKQSIVTKNIPIVVLINEGSASASEILAGALRDNREDVTIIGRQSFGKGSVQELIDLESGDVLKVTTAKWLTPKGNHINEIGITPDIDVEITKEDRDGDKDIQKNRAIEILRDTVTVIE